MNLPKIEIDTGMSDDRPTVLQPATREELPDDAELLKEMLWNVMQSNDELSQKVAWLQRMLFGKKSEKHVSPDQLALFEEAKKRLGLDKPDDDPPPRLPKDKAKSRRGGKRDKKRGRFLGGTVPKNTPVQTTRIELGGETCPECGEVLTKLGEDSRKRVAWVPGHFVVRETIVETGFCPKHASESLFTPDGPDFIVPGGALDNGLLNKVVIDKFADGLPLNRQAKRFARKGVHLPTSTLSRNVIAHAALGQHIVDAMRAELIASSWLQGDGTSLPILVGDRGEAHPGQLWVFSNGETAVFQVSMTKHGIYPKQFLEGFTGVWLADGASNYNEVARLDGVERAGCWAHARRYLFEARNDHIAVTEGLALVRDLFLDERQAMLLEPDERRAHRQRVAVPQLGRLKTWIDTHRTSEHVVKRPKSPFAKALKYLTNQWEPLGRFVDHPEIPVHNNRSELLRTPVTGRKAWLFAGSPMGADAAAIEFSLVTSCMLVGEDPAEYLDEVMPSLWRKTPTEIAELTPSRWARRRRQERMTDRE